MKNKIKVLIVDDSFFMRKLLRDVLGASQSIEIVGEAKNGVEAIGEVLRLKPDIITMDFNMPDLNGAQTTEKILNETDYRPAIIMLSAYTQEGTKETFKSLRSGAVDFISKPSGELSLNIEVIKDELIDKIKLANQAKIKKYSKIKPKKSSNKKPKKTPVAKIIVIGSSTGGPPVVENIISKLPEDLPAAVMVAQHMPKRFTEAFAKRLNKITTMEVREAKENDLVMSGLTLVAPGSHNTKVDKKEIAGIEKEIVKISKEMGKKDLCPSIDTLMTSIADCYGDKAVGIILTGMGSDGAEGIKKIKEAGGYAIVQDPKTTVVDSMVQSTIDLGVVDEILKPEDIVKKIIELSS